MELLKCLDNEEESISSEIRLNPAPIAPNERKDPSSSEMVSQICANYPLSEQKGVLAPKLHENVEEVTLDDAIWQQSRNQKPKNKKKSKKKHDIPWNEEESPKKEASITDRMSYSQRQQRRTWYPAIGNQELADTVVWHNSINIKNHLGQSWVMPPLTFIPNANHECCLPKAKVHVFSYHTSSLTNVEMFPVYGHMILSSSLDSTIRIWSLLGDRQCIQTYMGHTQGVRDVAFKRDGLRFASCCFAKRLKLWDTDKGKSVSSMLLDSVPSQLALSHSTDHDEEAFVSLQDGRIVHYDFRAATQKPVGEYRFSNVCDSYPASSVCLLPGSNFLVGASEDGKLALWSIGSPDPVSQYKESWLKPISSIVCHPKEAKIACQTYGNEIVVFNTEGELQVDKGRSFHGHKTDANPCRMSISPDGTFLASGDACGSLFIWDWKSTNIMKTFQAHDRVIVKAQWSPYDPSQIVTASYDNTMDLFD